MLLIELRYLCKEGVYLTELCWEPCFRQVPWPRLDVWSLHHEETVINSFSNGPKRSRLFLFVGFQWFGWIVLLASKFLKMVTIIVSLFLTSFPFHPPTFSWVAIAFLIYLFCEKLKQSCKLQRKFSNQAHLQMEQHAQLTVYVVIASCKVREFCLLWLIFITCRV